MEDESAIGGMSLMVDDDEDVVGGCALNDAVCWDGLLTSSAPSTELRRGFFFLDMDAKASLSLSDDEPLPPSNAVRGRPRRCTMVKNNQMGII